MKEIQAPYLIHNRKPYLMYMICVIPGSQNYQYRINGIPGRAILRIKFLQYLQKAISKQPASCLPGTTIST